MSCWSFDELLEDWPAEKPAESIGTLRLVRINPSKVTASPPKLHWEALGFTFLLVFTRLQASMLSWGGCSSRRGKSHGKFRTCIPRAQVASDVLVNPLLTRSMDLMDLAFSGGMQMWNGQPMPSYTPPLGSAVYPARTQGSIQKVEPP